jgi:hypothetical protein
VPPGEGGGALSTPRQLTVPSGWTARVWARVGDARMEAWTPEGDLLVSAPGNGSVMELRPDASAAATVIAPRLPDVDTKADDDHSVKDVTVAADGTVYFNVGSSSNANPDDRTMTPPRATIESVRPDGTDLQVVERGVRNGEGLAVAPNGVVWTAVNERDNVPYPSHNSYGVYADAFGQVIQDYVNEHPPTSRWSPTPSPIRPGPRSTAPSSPRSRSGCPRTARPSA